MSTATAQHLRRGSHERAICGVQRHEPGSPRRNAAHSAAGRARPAGHFGGFCAKNAIIATSFARRIEPNTTPTLIYSLHRLRGKAGVGVLIALLPVT